MAAGPAAFDIAELFSAIASKDSVEVRARFDAIACFLSVGEGWKEAKSLLHGNFAEHLGQAWLTANKE